MRISDWSSDVCSSDLKAELARGEHKSIQTDRVVLVPGPPEEAETVRWMYRAFVEGRAEREIAVLLNDRGIVTDLGRPWTRGTVHQVLINGKYAGDDVWNRISRSEEHTSELQSLMRISYAVFCLKKKNKHKYN